VREAVEDIVAKPREGLAVLVVDDSVFIRQRLVAMLNGLRGVDVVGEAATAAEAQRLTSELKPDVVTVDIVMPGGSGVEVIGWLMNLDCPPTCIVLTNYPYPAFRARCSQLGARYFLNKATEFGRIPDILEEIAKEKGDSCDQGN
jgi:DNA-binding NarL/FixJ family response regulator